MLHCLKCKAFDYKPFKYVICKKILIYGIDSDWIY
jgi:hypothetical protein